jgi:hypothetical protein
MIILDIALTGLADGARQTKNKEPVAVVGKNVNLPRSIPIVLQT